jgi:hypothetical protein
MNVELNWLAIFLATASSMVVGATWYSRSVFGNTWLKLVKLNDQQLQKGALKAILITIVVSFLTAYLLAHVSYLSNAFFKHSFFQDAVTTSFWMWLGFVATRFITHDAFEKRPFKLTLINITHELLTFLVMGVIIGLLPPIVVPEV